MATMKIKMCRQEMLTFIFSTSEVGRIFKEEGKFVTIDTSTLPDMDNRDFFMFTETSRLNRSGLVFKMNERERVFLYLDGDFLHIEQWGRSKLNTKSFLEFVKAHCPSALVDIIVKRHNTLTEVYAARNAPPES